MRAGIRATCDKCGVVHLRNEDITVRPCVDDPRQSNYFFVCPECGQRVVHLAHPRVVQLLAASVVNVQPWFLPCEMFEAHDGPPISEADLAAFREAIGA